MTRDGGHAIPKTSPVLSGSPVQQEQIGGGPPPVPWAQQGCVLVIQASAQTFMADFHDFLRLLATVFPFVFPTCLCLFPCVPNMFMCIPFCVPNMFMFKTSMPVSTRTLQITFLETFVPLLDNHHACLNHACFKVSIITITITITTPPQPFPSSSSTSASFSSSLSPSFYSTDVFVPWPCGMPAYQGACLLQLSACLLYHNTRYSLEDA